MHDVTDVTFNHCIGVLGTIGAPRGCRVLVKLIGKNDGDASSFESDIKPTSPSKQGHAFDRVGTDYLRHVCISSKLEALSPSCTVDGIIA